MMTPAQLRAARALLGWTAVDLMAKSGISRHAIGKIEAGRTSPQRKTLARIVGALRSGGVEFTDGGVRLR